MHPKSSREESWFPGFYWRGRPTFHKHHKRSLPSAICNWEGPWVCCLNWSGYWHALTQKKVGFPCSGLNAGSSFISQDEGMFAPTVGNLEKVPSRSPPHLGTMTHIFWHLARSVEFNSSKGDDAWLFLKIDRNPNITVPTRNGRLVSCLTFRRVRIVLPSLV